MVSISFSIKTFKVAREHCRWLRFSSINQLHGSGSFSSLFFMQQKNRYDYMKNVSENITGFKVKMDVSCLTSLYSWHGKRIFGNT